jgi:hypothetical protein
MIWVNSKKKKSYYVLESKEKRTGFIQSMDKIFLDSIPRWIGKHHESDTTILFKRV